MYKYYIFETFLIFAKVKTLFQALFLKIDLDQLFKIKFLFILTKKIFFIMTTINCYSKYSKVVKQIILILFIIFITIVFDKYI